MRLLDHAHTTQAIEALGVERWLPFLVLRQVGRNFNERATLSVILHLRSLKQKLLAIGLHA